MKFTEKEHEEFYNNIISEYRKNGGNVDCYSQSFFYLMGMSRDTRQHFHSLFSMKERCIIPSNFCSDWQTGTSYKICRLAFNLWNGYCYEWEEETDTKIVSQDYTMDRIFCCEYMEYFFEAVRLRYPCYSKNNKK